MGDTNLAQTISATNDSGSAYDTNVKCLLADKQILSWILKYTLVEFEDVELSDIRNCIGDDIEIDVRPVDAGLSNLGRIKETHTEDNVPGEGIIVNLRNGYTDLEDVKKSGNKLIAMLEELLSKKGVAEKKHILESEYGMIMTEELEGRMQIMCNLSELVKESGLKEGISQGISQERIAAIGRMIKANATQEQIISFGYTKEEIEKAENALYANV